MTLSHSHDVHARRLTEMGVRRDSKGEELDQTFLEQVTRTITT